ncbi:MAG: V-type ATP synthase subunit E [Bacteroidota bacterium]
MAEINNIEKLTDKIYQEGVEKAQKESKEIISSAEVECNRILEEARKEAKSIVAKAEQEAAKTIRSTENELKLKGKQFISDLQDEIRTLLSSKILKNGTSAAFADAAFLKSAILEAIGFWKSSDDLELILPQELEKKLDKAFQGSIKEHTQNLTVSFNDKMSSGFTIVDKEESYQISFSENEFIMLFGSYLTDKTNQVLFSDLP